MSVSFTRIRVSDHAMWRAAERFRYFDVAEIEGEVRAALAAGRMSWQKPKAMRAIVNTGSYFKGFYAWTPDGRRVYGILPHARDATELVVATTMIGGA